MLQSFRKIIASGICLLIATLCSQSACGQYGDVASPPDDLTVGFDSITPEQSQEWLNILAGPTFEGRGTGQPGYAKAAHWVAGKLAEFGLEPIGDGGTYFQSMPFTRRSVDLANCKMTGPDGIEINCEGKMGFQRFTDDASVEGEIVFLNLDAEELVVPDGIELRDKIVIYSTGDRRQQRSASRLLAEKLPSAAFRVVDETPVTVPQTLFPGRRSRSTGVSGTISQSAVTELAGKLGLSGDEWNDAGKMPSLATGKKLELQMRLREEQKGSPNVVAWLEGSDPKLRHEYMVIGAHLDHLGAQGEVYYPGADDNGSGSTAILSIAKAMAMNPVKPKRSVLFIWFTAEEVGLVGSRYYTSNPLLPLEDMTCMFNIDMVGRNEDTGEGDADADNEGHMHLVGSMRGESGLHEIVLEANKYVGFEFELDMESVWNRSDQVNFYNEGVPVAFMFGGFHPDYHQTGDVPSKINYKKLASAARLYYMALHLAAQHDHFEMKAEADESEGRRE